LSITTVALNSDVVVAEPIFFNVKVPNTSGQATPIAMHRYGHLEWRTQNHAWQQCVRGDIPLFVGTSPRPLPPDAFVSFEFELTACCALGNPDSYDIRYVYELVDEEPATAAFPIASSSRTISVSEPTGVDRDALDALNAGSSWRDVYRDFPTSVYTGYDLYRDPRRVRSKP
jgi:hypothetical protein